MPPSEGKPVVAVTGATGFIGRRLIPALVLAGFAPRILTRRDPAHADWAGLQIEVVPGSLEDAAALRSLVTGAVAVVHLAGLVKAANEARFMAANRDGTRALAQALRDHAAQAHLVHVSSLAAREPQLSVYARSKRAGEEAALEMLGDRVSVLRPPAVYGPGDRETLVFFKAGTMPWVPVPGRASARTALIHVGDLAAALAALVTAPPSGAVHAIADACPLGYSWREIMEAAASAAGRPGARQIALSPAALRPAGLLGDIARLMGHDSMLSSGKLRELLHEDWSVTAGELSQPPGWRPRYGLDEGFRDAVRWYRQRGWL